MFNPSVFAKILNKISLRIRPVLAPIRRSRLKKTDFTIISNNCWGGHCYEHFGLPKQSPTVGAFFFASEYIRFVKDLHRYLTEEIKFIDVSKSKHIDFLKTKKISCPIGVLGDIEVFFLHYPNEKIAKEKWVRRIKRVNWNNLIFKFSLMNECTLEQLRIFDELDLPGKKIMFVNKPNMGFKCGVYYPGYENDTTIENDTFYWNRYLDVVKFLNN